MAAVLQASFSSFPPSFSSFTCQSEGRKSYAWHNIRGSFTIQDRKTVFWKKVQKGVNGWESRKSTAMKEKTNILTKAIRDDIRDISLGPNGMYHILFTDGGQAWRGLPTELYNQLRSRNPKLPGVSFVSLGPQGEWFVKFKDQSCCWEGLTASEFDLAVKDYNGTVESVTFGPNQTWFVRFCDGYANTDGLPLSQRNRIASLKQNGHDIERVALGSNGDWCMSFDTGHTRFCSTDEDIMNWLRNGNGNVKVVFGCNEEFAIIRDFSVVYWSVSEYFEESIEYEECIEESLEEFWDSQFNYRDFDDFVYMDPEFIRYTQESINSNFGGGHGTIYDLCHQLFYGIQCAEDFPHIRVVHYCGVYWSLDNRRLWAFKNAYRQSIPVKIVFQGPEFFRKLTTSSGGLSINVI